MTSPNADNDSPAGNGATKLPEYVAGRYRIRKLLGRGGFGAVFEAFDELEERAVALKLIRTDVSVDNPRSTRSLDTPGSSRSKAFPAKRGLVTRSFGKTPSTLGDDLTQAFKDEFRLLTQLHHPNLAGVYDFGRCAELDGLFFTQELVPGQELTDFFKDASREAIVEVFVQLARALDYIHALGLVHGDIKPSNVLVCPPDAAGSQPQAKLIDFGLARMLRGKSDEPELEDPGGLVILGTPGFSAPEKVKGDATDSRSDVYSLAATIHAAVRGQRLFPGKSFKEALRAQQDWRPELAGALLQSCGPVVAELVGRMLMPDPDKRPQSARSIVLELLRREATHLRDHGQTEHDRREFARVLVEHLPFVDRAHYLELLLDKATAVLRPELDPEDPATPSNSASASRSGARGGLIRSVVVEAPEGMGKHRLMSELRREIQLGDGMFIEASCWSQDQTALGPYGSLVIQLITVLGDRSPAVQRFPALIKLARDRSGDETAAQQLSEFLIAAADERSYVLHLSDLSHAPEPTRTTFESLCRAVDHSEARNRYGAPTEPHNKIVAVLQALGRDQLAELWHLRPFSQREMFSILEGVLGDTTVLRELVSMLDKLTGGHPLSLRETLRVLIEESILNRESDSGTPRSASAAAEELHKTLAQRSEARLDGLGVSAWEIASVLYLLEAPIDEAQLAELSDLRRERFQRTLTRLEGEGLIVRSAVSGASRIQLAHESVREAVRGRYEDSLDETRLDLAARIEEIDTHDPNFIFLRARLLDDASEGLDATGALEEAAQQLFDAGQPQLGAQVLERLITKLRRHGRTAILDRLLRAKLMLLEHAAGALEDPAREMGHYEAGILIAELLHDHRAQALFWLGLVDRFLSSTAEEMELTLERLEQAAEAAKLAHDRVLELRIANRRSEVLLGAGDVEKASRWSQLAMEILDLDEASNADKSHIIGVRLRCLSLSGHLGEARKLHEMAKPVAATVPVVKRQSYLSGIAYLAALGGEATAAIPEIESAIEELRAANLPRLLQTPLHNLGDLRLRGNDLEGAENAFREAMRLGSLYGFGYNVHLNRGFLGYVFARQGNPEEGAELLADAKRGIMAIPGEHVALQQLRLLDAEVAHALGQSARARRELEEMLADFHRADELSLAHWAQQALARIEEDLGTSFIETPTADLADGDPNVDTIRTKPVK